MKRKCAAFLVITLIVLLAAFSFPSPAFARSMRLIDEQGLLSPSRASELISVLDEISERHQFDVAVATVYSKGGQDIKRYAADFFEQNGFGYGENLDGIILLISMEHRDFAFVTTGYGMYAFTSAGQAYLEKIFLPSLRRDDYFDAFMKFATAADDFLIKAKAGTPYDRGNIPFFTDSERSAARVFSFIASVILALIIAAVAVAGWKSQLKTARKQSFAGAYIRKDSMKITSSQDIFVKKRTTTTPRASSSGGGSGGGSVKSSSGRSFSGRSGKF